MNQKDLRIVKLHKKGVAEEDIARKIGYGGNIAAGVERVREALRKAGILNQDQHGNSERGT